jgi:hypothetical protein
VLPDDNGEIASDLMRLPKRTLRGLLDVFSVLRTQDDRLFEAHREWMLEDAGGASLAEAITDRLGFAGWVERKAHALPLDKWLDEVHRLVKLKSPFHYASNGLGSPKFENGIDKLCYEKGMSPQEALDWWRKQ